MVTASPLLITHEAVAQLVELRERAAKHPVDMTKLEALLSTNNGRMAHRAQMTSQSVFVPGAPWDFFITYSVETGHPVGLCRHMSMSVDREGRVPSPEGVWMVAEYLGFVGGLSACTLYLDDLSDGGKAVNIVQPVDWLPAVSQAVH